MIKLIVGSRGSGKTKQMVELINVEVKTAQGNIVCIEKGMQLTYDLDHKCRLIDMEEYRIEGREALYGFVAGILAGNYDIETVYIDGVMKVLAGNLDELGGLLEKLKAVGSGRCRFVISVSAEEAALPGSVRAFYEK